MSSKLLEFSDFTFIAGWFSGQYLYLGLIGVVKGGGDNGEECLQVELLADKGSNGGGHGVSDIGRFCMKRNTEKLEQQTLYFLFSSFTILQQNQRLHTIAKVIPEVKYE